MWSVAVNYVKDGFNVVLMLLCPVFKLRAEQTSANESRTEHTVAVVQYSTVGVGTKNLERQKPTDAILNETVCLFSGHSFEASISQSILGYIIKLSISRVPDYFILV
jgi:hypothetical protein